MELSEICRVTHNVDELVVSSHSYELSVRAECNMSDNTPVGFSAPLTVTYTSSMKHAMSHLDPHPSQHPLSIIPAASRYTPRQMPNHNKTFVQTHTTQSNVRTQIQSRIVYRLNNASCPPTATNLPVGQRPIASRCAE